MATTRTERPIPTDIPQSGQALLADITNDTVWSAPRLQYYLGGNEVLGWNDAFRTSFNEDFQAPATPFAYAPQTVRSFETIDAVIDIDMVRIGANGARQEADMVVVTGNALPTSATLEGFFFFPGTFSRAGGDGWNAGVFNASLDTLNVAPERGGGEYLYWTVIHEIGHGMGILHPFSGNGIRPSVGDALDDEQYTVMSYTGATDANAYGHAITPMALDIAALQAQYGASDLAMGNSSYTLTDPRSADLRLAEGNVQIGRAYYSIWDAGGTDTIRYGTSANSVMINLNDATLDRSRVASDVAPSITALQNTAGWDSLSAVLQRETANDDYHAGGFFSRVISQSGGTWQGIDGGFSIANGADIENAVGNSNADFLIGNELANVLTGAGGNDTMIGGRGNDMLQGGAGIDTAGYSGNGGEYTLSGGDGTWTISHAGADGTDTLVGVETLAFANSTFDLRTAMGGAGRDETFTGRAVADTLEGGSGNDSLSGLGGDDVLYGDTATGGDDGGGDPGGRVVPMGNGFVSFSNTVRVPNGINTLNEVAVRLDAGFEGGAGFSLAGNPDIGDATTTPHITARVLGNGTKDYYAVTVQAGDALTFDIDASNGVDTVLQLYTATGGQVAVNDDSAIDPGSNATEDSLLVYQVETAGTYYLEVAQYFARDVGLYVTNPVPTDARYDLHFSIDTADTPNGPSDAGNSPIISSPGNDRISGGIGNDRIWGGDGADTILGDDGNDVLFGGDSTADLRDLIYGGDGNDAIDGGYGNDSLNGGNGNDTIEGGFGADTVVGNGGNDVLTGSAFGDLIFGNDGFDFINGGFGSDRVNGGAGADRFFHVGVAGHGSDWIQDYSGAGPGGEGDRLVWGGAAAGIGNFQVNLATTAGAGGAAQEAFVIYRPTGQILWALVDGAQEDIRLQIGSDVFALA